MEATRALRVVLGMWGRRP